MWVRSCWCWCWWHVIRVTCNIPQRPNVVVLAMMFKYSTDFLATSMPIPPIQPPTQVSHFQHKSRLSPQRHCFLRTLDTHGKGLSELHHVTEKRRFPGLWSPFALSPRHQIRIPYPGYVSHLAYLPTGTRALETSCFSVAMVYPGPILSKGRLGMGGEERPQLCQREVLLVAIRIPHVVVQLLVLLVVIRRN